MLEGKLTDKTYFRSATRHSSSRSGETDQGPSQGLPTQALALLNLPKQMHLSITDNLTTDLLNEHLIKGYLVPSEAKTIPPLQLRRTLDQYFYTHLKSTSQRDSDQVVYRYTKGAFQPKIFMVDQLWLWIFDDGNTFTQILPNALANISPQKQS